MTSQMVDGYGRVHRDLRVSLTDRCSLRCTYCMPAEGLPWLARAEMLTTAELLRVVGVAVDLGVTRVRLTGGEPLLRPDIVEIVAAIAAMPGAPEVAVTTNALRLAALAGPLADAGLGRVNISLDTTDRDTYRRLTGRDRLPDALGGVAAAKAAGLFPVKINSVLLRGINDGSAPELLLWSLGEGVDLRFIEQMPLDPQHGWSRAQMVTGAEIHAALAAAGFELTPRPGRGSAPAEVFDVNGGQGTVGIVASVTRPFCGACDRVRLTADGQWRTCLFATTETDVRAVLRSGADDDAVAEVIRTAVLGKGPGHSIGAADFHQPSRPMSAIGG